ncbi:LLM class flavin-dependent oxidoreductase [Natronorubrum texcoconense]|uniref:Flavin-dependent oxidoreductase, luciferase family (Includes alkanesulfonate monooxygenase SsuD and methylene tetrahydromethanopterin reductase) n=1 Tax=Natronorubrum texcoconense TaxID=1095776 RepID=A0A1G9DF40_9EURY|nr:LLM class flavin-dependent oxidoreductase [Natronorubrum texcoconense]SDK62515.1 Flavin-dependent oxidoreductase, luciferase family (includes alkanesulfonate monooxygenase SsuD and methylene tetrahydromethanopterin reductase) [Natronorubrum texcoconense]
MVSHGYVLPTRGVVLSADDSLEQAARVQSEVIGLARRAESLGFDGVWAGDSVLAKPRLEPLSTLAAVAGATESVTLGTAVYLPQLRHPVHVAHQTATVDLVSGGRLALGVGVGVGDGVETEHDQLDVPYERRGALLDEGLEILEGLWSNDPVSVDGEFFELDDADIGIRPCGSSPPIYIASATFDPRDGFPRQIRDRIATRGGGWLPIGMSPEMYEGGLDRAREIVDDAGRDPAGFDAAYYHDVVIAETEAAAIDQARDFLDRYYPSWGALSDDDIRNRGAFGPPSVVADHLERYADAGVETFITRFTAADQREQLRRFADIVD